MMIAQNIGSISRVNTRGVFFTSELFFSALLFLLLTMVVVQINYNAAGLAGFDINSAVQLADDAADGSKLRQVFYLFVFFLTALSTYALNKSKALIPIPTAYAVAVSWCLLSSVYAIVPGISIRRSIGMAIILFSVAACVQNLGFRKTITVVRMFLIVVISLSFISVLFSKIPLFAFAVHPGNEADISLRGAWRGILPHKNVAGAVMVHSSILFFSLFLIRKKALDLLFFFLAIIFLYFTHSKTSFGLLGTALLSSVIYMVLQRYRSRALFNLMWVVIVFSGALLALVSWNQIDAYFSDPSNLSGRVGIWMSVAPYIEHHPLLGSGYGSYWKIGDQSPIFRTAITAFIATIGHAHNGYIEILLSTGLVGLTLALIALAVVPYLRFAGGVMDREPLMAPLYGMWLFGMLQNMTEAQFFSPDKQSWIFVVIAITAVHHRQCRTFSNEA